MADDMDRRSQEIGNAIDTIETQIRQQIARTRSGTTAVLVIGLILIAIVFAVFTKITGGIKDAMKPLHLAEAIHGMAAARIPEVMSKVEEELSKNPGETVKLAREKIAESIPDLRKQAEASFRGLIDDLSARLDAKVDDLVSDVLTQLKPEVEPMIEAARVKGNWQPLEDAFKKGLMNAIGPKCDEVALEFDRKMIELELHIDPLLQPDEKLTESQRFERDLIRAMLVYLCDVLEGAVMDQTPKRPG